MVDFHNHLMPGVDDGASSDEEAAAGVDALRAQGVRGLIVTPHVDGSLTLRPEALQTRLAELDAAWHRLCRLAGERWPQLVLRRGCELALDTPEPDVTDARLRLAGGRYVLTEYPYMNVPPQSFRVLDHIRACGYVPIVAHPERYAGMTPDSPLPYEWRSHGALLQVNAGSLAGRYGPQARDNAIAFLERAVVDFVCSDYHARGRPSLTSARRVLDELDAAEHADLLMRVNPRRMMDGDDVIPVPPLRVRRRLVDRVRSWLR